MSVSPRRIQGRVPVRWRCQVVPPPTRSTGGRKTGRGPKDPPAVSLASHRRDLCWERSREPWAASQKPYGRTGAARTGLPQDHCGGIGRASTLEGHRGDTALWTSGELPTVVGVPLMRATLVAASERMRRRGTDPRTGRKMRRVKRLVCRVATIAACVTCLTRLLLNMPNKDYILVEQPRLTEVRLQPI